VQRLEKEKRRTERLLYLTRKVVRPGPMKTAIGRPSKKKTRSSSKTSSSMSTSMMRASKGVKKTSSSSTENGASTPTKAGEAAS
jgi:hypothetical protein